MSDRSSGIFGHEKPGFYAKSLLSGENYPRNPVSDFRFLFGYESLRWAIAN